MGALWTAACPGNAALKWVRLICETRWQACTGPRATVLTLKWVRLPARQPIEGQRCCAEMGTLRSVRGLSGASRATPPDWPALKWVRFANVNSHHRAIPPLKCMPIFANAEMGTPLSGPVHNIWGAQIWVRQAVGIAEMGTPKVSRLDGRSAEMALLIGIWACLGLSWVAALKWVRLLASTCSNPARRGAEMGTLCA